MMRDTTTLRPLIMPLRGLVVTRARRSLVGKIKRRTKRQKAKAMRQLNYSFKQLCERNKDGSFGTRGSRADRLTLIANQLHQLGFRHMSAQSLKPKHVEALVEKWKTEGLSAGTIKNRMTDLRWWAEKVGKENVIAITNDAYGIVNRTFVTNISKARELTVDQLSKVSDPYTAISLRLQAAFGLRREESIKIQPAWADRKDRLILKDSWTKGGRAREIPICNEEQRQVLSEAKALAGNGSLIPLHKSYIQQVKRFEYQCGKAGINHVHGHRHAYAQDRYKELTGRECPARGGLKSKELNIEQKSLDREARLAISRELGHEREQITAIYLGR